MFLDYGDAHGNRRASLIHIWPEDIIFLCHGRRTVNIPKCEAVVTFN